jgi:N-acetylmuramoyl-L-alanine amidase
MRQIKQIIIHCSATPEGKNIGATTIRGWHKERGFTDIGYHYVIRLDGTIEQGRPIEQIGAHCQGHNRNSIGICYIGGLSQKRQPKDTRTIAQRQAMKQLIQELQEQFPEATLHGHREFAAKACPCFDIEDL